MAVTPGKDLGSENMTEFKFKHFDILSEDSAISDHQYVFYNKSSRAQAAFSNPRSPVSRKIAKEWRILEQGLPELIYVRVYEQRIDLLRAVIVGIPGTPYHDGLFFFDIVLPPDYPNQPPNVYHHAHGYRLNPNLYGSGYVCLSLLNTWEGRSIEKWTPSSTLLQVLLSIQGLVLNDKPYFNEPGYEVGLRQLRKNGSKYLIAKYMNYNHDVFILSCKIMMQKLKRPPKGFESFVLEHFRQRQDVILAALEAYGDGTAVVGLYGQDGQPSTGSLRLKCDKRGLSKIHSNLCKAFKEHGISKSEDVSKARATEEKPTEGLGRRIIRALAKIFR